MTIWPLSAFIIWTCPFFVFETGFAISPTPVFGPIPKSFIVNNNLEFPGTTVGVGVGEVWGVGDVGGVRFGVKLGDGVGVRVGVGEADGVGVALGVGVGVLVGDGVGVLVAVGVWVVTVAAATPSATFCPLI